MEDLYSIKNLKESFSGTTHGPHPISIAMLDISRIYSAYEDANFVLEEVRRPSGRRDKSFSLRSPGCYLPGLVLLHDGQHFAGR